MCLPLLRGRHQLPTLHGWSRGWRLAWGVRDAQIPVLRGHDSQHRGDDLHNDCVGNFYKGGEGLRERVLRWLGISAALSVGKVASCQHWLAIEQQARDDWIQCINSNDDTIPHVLVIARKIRVQIRQLARELVQIHGAVGSVVAAMGARRGRQQRRSRGAKTIATAMMLR
eukprot:scaffold270_cov390-Prasinococcus_capsulatus_cf.AAC.3